MLAYARKLTRAPWSCSEEELAAIRKAGGSDEQILSAVQVAAYFNYVNRLADGLGVEPESRL